MKKVVVLGGGIAGVAAAKLLGDSFEVEVFEKEGTPGGLLRTFEEKGFYFDTGGHLFHFSDRRFVFLFEKLMEGNFYKLERRAFVYVKNELIPFPFQANLYRLPERVKFRCLKDFLDARHSPAKTPPSNFEEWLLYWFGKGMCENFFFPYNRKFWKEDLKKFSSDWAEWAVPKPTVEQVIRGARGEIIEGLGYNPVFYYPKEGGSFSFFERYRGELPIYSNREVQKISLSQRKVYFKGGESRRFDFLISTIPLVELLELIEEKNEQLIRIRSLLSSTSLVIYNLGFKEKVLEGVHWVYFPEEEYPFHRIGVYSNFSESMAPAESSSLYLEVSFSKEPPEDKILKISLAKLRHLGWINSDPVVIKKIIVPYAYPHPTREKEIAMDFLQPFLEKRGIYLLGRRGSWNYLSVEGVLQRATGLASRLKLKLQV